MKQAKVVKGLRFQIFISGKIWQPKAKFGFTVLLKKILNLHMIG